MCSSAAARPASAPTLRAPSRAITRALLSSTCSAQKANLRHHFFAAQAVHPQMRELGFGSIINISSIAWRGAAEMPAYAAAKAGIVGLTHSLARAFGPDNIRVNAIEPGAVMTDRQQRLWYKTPESVDAIVQRQSIKTTLIGEDI